MVFAYTATKQIQIDRLMRSQNKTLHLVIPLTAPYTNYAHVSPLYFLFYIFKVEAFQSDWKDENIEVTCTSCLTLLIYSDKPSSGSNSNLVPEFLPHFYQQGLHIIGEFEKLEKPYMKDLQTSPYLPSTYWTRIIKFLISAKYSDYDNSHSPRRLDIGFFLHSAATEIIGCAMWGETCNNNDIVCSY